MASNGTSPPNNNRLSTNSVNSLPLPLLLRKLLMNIQQTTTDTSAPAELSAVVDELLNSLSNKFAGVSSEIFAKSMFPHGKFERGGTPEASLGSGRSFAYQYSPK